MEKSEFDRKFGEFVRKMRQEKGWSQMEVAAKVGNNFQNISRLENGKVSPTLYWVSNLAEVFELRLSDFIASFQAYQDT